MIDYIIICLNLVLFIVLLLTIRHLQKESSSAFVSSLKKEIEALKGNAGTSPSSSDAPAGDHSELMELVSKYDSHFSLLAKGMKEYHQQTEKSLKKTMDAGTRLEGMMGGVRDYLAMKNDLTSRLQEGYDYKILKNFTKQIIRCIHQIDPKLADDSVAGKKLLSTREDLIDMLDRYGIEQFLPEVGAPYSELRKIAEVVPQKEPTKDKDQVGTVAEIIRPGYSYQAHDEQRRIVMPAQVKIYEAFRR